MLIATPHTQRLLRVTCPRLIFVVVFVFVFVFVVVFLLLLFAVFTSLFLSVPLMLIVSIFLQQTRWRPRQAYRCPPYRMIIASLIPLHHLSPVNYYFIFHFHFCLSYPPVLHHLFSSGHFSFLCTGGGTLEAATPGCGRRQCQRWHWDRLIVVFLSFCLTFVLVFFYFYSNVGSINVCPLYRCYFWNGSHRHAASLHHRRYVPSIC